MEIDSRKTQKSDLKRLWACGITIITATAIANTILNTELYIKIISVPAAVLLLHMINISGILEAEYDIRDEPLPIKYLEQNQ